jgi:WD40 repeat protein
VSLFSVPPTLHLAPVPSSPFATGSGKSPYSVAFNPQKDRQTPFFATANWIIDNTISVFALKNGVWQPPVSYPNGVGPFACIGGGTGPEEVAFHPSGGWLATANFTAGSVSMFSVQPSGGLALLGSPVAVTPAPPLAGGCGNPVNSLAFSPNGARRNFLATGGGFPAGVQMFKFSGGGLTQVFATAIGDGNSGAANSVAFHPSGLLLAAADAGGVSLFGVQSSGALVRQAGSPSPIAGNPNPRSLAFSADGKWLAVGAGSWASNPAVYLFAVA